ncbi:MAG: hypothetical protein R3A10_08695 [Caldilineaceae bacterium]
MRAEVRLLARAVAQALGVDGGAAVDWPWDPNWVNVGRGSPCKPTPGAASSSPGREQSPVVHTPWPTP